jgi:putative SOS response-associated peptidase YedK
MAMAGLWDTWKDKKTGEIIDTCTVLTRDSGGAVRALHDRMPVILPEGVHDAWLDPGTTDPASLLASPIIEALVTIPIDDIPPNVTVNEAVRNDSQQKLFG